MMSSLLSASFSKMKAREKYQSDLWLEIEHLNKGEELRSKRVWGSVLPKSGPIALHVHGPSWLQGSQVTMKVGD